jgi:co-chaperonin GroES (HSP10)
MKSKKDVKSEGKLTLIGKRVAISPQEPAKSASGLILTEKKEENIGTVVAVGEGVFVIKVGDLVAFSKFKLHNKVTYDKNEVLLVDYDDVLAVLTK